MNRIPIFISNLMLLVFVSSLTAQSNVGGDILDEIPLHPVPEEMTFEEYQDMNRRLGIGLALAATVPVPGIVHHYAGEKETAKKLFYISAGGFATFIAAAVTSDPVELEWPESDYEIFYLNEGQDNERRFEKIPTGMNGDSTYFKFNQIYKEESRGDGKLFVLGAAAILGVYLYDTIHGLKMIHDKREAVRYKFGKNLKLSLRPSLDPFAREAGIGLQLYF